MNVHPALVWTQTLVYSQTERLLMTESPFSVLPIPATNSLRPPPLTAPVGWVNSHSPSRQRGINHPLITQQAQPRHRDLTVESTEKALLSLELVVQGGTILKAKK